MKRYWKFLMLSLVLSVPLAAVMVIGEWSVMKDMLTFNVPWWYWAYTITSGLALAYFQIRYFDKPK